MQQEWAIKGNCNQLNAGKGNPEAIYVAGTMQTAGYKGEVGDKRHQTQLSLDAGI